MACLVDPLVPWEPRFFVVPEDEMDDALYVAWKYKLDTHIEVGYSPATIHDLVQEVTRSMAYMIVNNEGSFPQPHSPIPPNRRLT